MHRNMTRHRVNSSVLLQHLSPLSLCLTVSLSLSPLRLISKASSLECDSLLAFMNMTTWSCVCSEMSRPLMRTTRSPSWSFGSHRPAWKTAQKLQLGFKLTLSVTLETQTGPETDNYWRFRSNEKTYFYEGCVWEAQGKERLEPSFFLVQILMSNPNFMFSLRI